MAYSAITDIATYLTFTLGDEQYAVDVVGVREILDFSTLTKVPRMPEFVRGVINLRGSVVPVVDMRLKFGMTRTEEMVDTCIVVIEVKLDGEATVIGALADSVNEVFEMSPELIEPPPNIGTRINTKFIKGMGKRDDMFIIILEIDKVFSEEELYVVAEADTQLEVSEERISAKEDAVEETPKGGKKRKKAGKKKAGGSKAAGDKGTDEISGTEQPEPVDPATELSY